MARRSAFNESDDELENETYIKAEDDENDEDYHDEDDKPGEEGFDPEGEGKKSRNNYKSPRKSAAGRKLMRWNRKFHPHLPTHCEPQLTDM